MSNGSAWFLVLAARQSEARVSVVAFETVKLDPDYKDPQKREEYIKRMSWDLDEDLLEAEVPLGLSVVLVEVWWSQGMEDGDGGANILGVRPLPLPPWRDALSEMVAQAEEDLRKRQEEEDARLIAWIAQMEAEEADSQPTA